MKYKVLLVTGLVDKEHDYRRTNAYLTEMLESTGIFDVKITEEFNGTTGRTLAGYDLVLMNYDGKEWLNDPIFTYWDDSTMDSLYQFVAEGKGIVFYHSSFSYGNGTPEEYLKMMGGGHNLKTGGRRNPKSDFIVKNADEQHPIMKGLDKEWMDIGDDFLPVITWHPEAKPHVLATVYDALEDYDVPDYPPASLKEILMPDGDLSKMPEINTDQPVAWTNEYGKGRSFIITIGHDIDTLRRMNYIVMFVRGCEWAASGNVTLPVPDRSGDNRFIPWPYYRKQEEKKDE